VGEADQRLEAEGPGAALDRVHRAEHRIDGFGVGLSGLHGQEAGFQFGELFLALLEEDVLDRRKRIHCLSSSLA
jgi:hypothetical protein